MTNDPSMSRRGLLVGIGTAATSGVTAGLVGRAVPARAEESRSGAIAPSILAFDVNESLLDSSTWRRCFGGCSATANS